MPPWPCSGVEHRLAGFSSWKPLPAAKVRFWLSRQSKGVVVIARKTLTGEKRERLIDIRAQLELMS